MASPDAQPGREGWTRCCVLTEEQPTEGQAPPCPIGDDVLIIFVHPPGSGLGRIILLGEAGGGRGPHGALALGSRMGGVLTPPRAKGHLPSWGAWGWGWEPS